MRLYDLIRVTTHRFKNTVDTVIPHHFLNSWVEFKQVIPTKHLVGCVTNDDDDDI